MVKKANDLQQLFQWEDDKKKLFLFFACGMCTICATLEVNSSVCALNGTKKMEKNELFSCESRSNLSCTVKKVRRKNSRIKFRRRTALYFNPHFPLRPL